MLTKENSVILQKKLHPKLKDPKSFMIPYTIGSSYFVKILCDLGKRVNLMSFLIFRKLGLGEPKPTIVSLQFADRFIKYPGGIIEDVLVKVEKLFIFFIFFCGLHCSRHGGGCINSFDLEETFLCYN